MLAAATAAANIELAMRGEGAECGLSPLGFGIELAVELLHSKDGEHEARAAADVGVGVPATGL